MTLVVDLTPEEETRLKRAAETRGVAEVEVVRELVRTLPDATGVQPTSGREVLEIARAEGLLGVFADQPDSPEFARQLREQLQSERQITL